MIKIPKGMKEAEIWGIAKTDDQEGNIVFIRPLDTELSVPIFIGQLEAQAILLGFGGVPLPRPLTADLLLDLAARAGFTIKWVEISDLKDNTFYARAVFQVEKAGEGTGEDFSLDARPSDVLALAVRRTIPIYIAQKIVEVAGIRSEDIVTSGQEDRLVHRDLLKSELDEAVFRENYEKAAEIRDMLLLLDQDDEDFHGK